jgi:hypothetical protein
MKFDDPLEEADLAFYDIQELLAWLRRRAEADEVDGVACGQRIADLALRLEAANAWPLASGLPPRGDPVSMLVHGGL